MDSRWIPNREAIMDASYSDVIVRLVERLKMEGEKSLAFFGNIPVPLWDMTIYTEGTHWSIRQILAHFIASESAFRALISNIRKGGKGAPEDFDIDEFNEKEVIPFNNVYPETLLERFEQSRLASIELVSEITTEELQLNGRHPFLGKTSLEETIKLLYRHNQIHQRDIRRILAETKTI